MRTLSNTLVWVPSLEGKVKNPQEQLGALIEVRC